MATGWVERAIAEREALKARMDKLTLFIETDEFLSLGVAHRSLLQQQLVHMSRYCNVLKERIELA
jgi:hypothetical protein